MNSTTDLRVIKTLKSLSNTFHIMLCEKQFEDITIQELCNRAMIRRATFYKHFADKYDFFAYSVRTMYQSFPSSAILSQQNRTKESYLKLIVDVLDFLSSNEKLVQSILKSNLFPIMIDIISEEITKDIIIKLSDDYKNRANLSAQPEIVSRFYIGAILNIIQWWIQKKPQMSQEDLIIEISKMIIG